MTLEQFKALFSDSIPIAYRFFPETSGQYMPFVVYYETESENFIADNKVYTKNRKINLELYTKGKDLESEALVENILSLNSIPWEAYDTYNTDEKCNERIYTLSI